ncbi:MAG: GAF domain-containing sensor histidine kinase [Chloroflexi bacterium]|nr:GAF domain-containing sensor histidine kinase [Chloroflexota bacterium]
MRNSPRRLRRMERILAISRELASILSPEEILHRIVQVAADVIKCESVGILLLNEQTNDLRFVAVTRFQNQLLDIPVPIASSIAGAAFTTAQPVIVNQVADDPRYYPRVAATTGVPARTLLAVPLQFRNRKIGVLEAENKKRYRRFDAVDVETLTALAVQTTIAIENARLFEQAQQEISARARVEDELRQQRDQFEARVADRTRELSALYAVSAIATRSQNLETLLNESLAQVMTALHCSSGAILLTAEKTSAVEPARLQLVAHCNMPPDLALPREMFPTEGGWFAALREQRRPLVISDVAADSRAPAAMRALGSQALLMSPLYPDGQMLGVIGLLRGAEQAFTAEEIALVTTVSDQMAIALHSHRLRQMAQQAALLEERHRLARDLHDSVTQALYGVTLFAQASQSSIRVGNLPLTGQYIGRLNETARQALKEMRLLIFELRPSLLEQVGLAGALRQRMEAVERRAGVAIELKVAELPDLPGELESHLYQIAQEALNNILKHSAATWVALRLTMEARQLHLAIEDNGKGFDPAKVGSAAGIGFASMRERAERIGGRLQIDSKPGVGTRVSLTVPVVG